MPVITKTTKKVIVRFYGVGLDVVDAFSEDKEFYHNWNTAKHEASAKGQRVFTTVQEISYGDISEA